MKIEDVTWDLIDAFLKEHNIPTDHFAKRAGMARQSFYDGKRGSKPQGKNQERAKNEMERFLAEKKIKEEAQARFPSQKAILNSTFDKLNESDRALFLHLVVEAYKFRAVQASDERHAAQQIS